MTVIGLCPFQNIKVIKDKLGLKNYSRSYGPGSVLEPERRLITETTGEILIKSEDWGRMLLNVGFLTDYCAVAP